MKELYEKVQKELDGHRVDMWHSVMLLSEDGAGLLEELCEVSYPNVAAGENGLFLHQNEQCSIEPKDSPMSTLHGMMFEDKDYIYQTLSFEHYDSHHACPLAQITRLDKQRKL
tara:strand:+ start:525 stop:863 length:339 start_codon:yes stop_codon:yes gene_type:complete